MDFGFILPFLFVLFFIIIPAFKKSAASSVKPPNPNTGGSSASDNFRAQIEAAREEMRRRGINTEQQQFGTKNQRNMSRNESGIASDSDTTNSASGGMSTRRSRDDKRSQARSAMRSIMSERARKNPRQTDDAEADARLTASNRDRLRAGNKGRDDWGARGDSGLSSGKAIMIYGLLGFLALFIISQVAPDLLKF